MDKRRRMVTVAAPRDFAEDYPRNEEGLILFPRDSDYRKELFPLLKLDDHPAKANIYLVQAIIEYVSQPGDTILDIMAGCYDDQTEALTKEGWKLFRYLTLEDKLATLNLDSGFMEYQNPTKLLNEPYQGKMYKVSTTQVDLVVTPDHNMLVAKRKSNLPRKDWKYKIIAAKDIAGKCVMYKKDAKWQGKRIETITIGSKTIPMDSWLKFFGLWLAEGSTSHTKCANKGTSYPHNIGLRNSDTAMLQEMLYLLKSWGYKPHNISEETKIQLADKDLWSYLEPLGTADQKYIPREYMELCSEQLEILLSYYLAGDGGQYKDIYRVRPRIASWTSSPRLAGDLQEVALKTGWSANVYQETEVGDLSFMSLEGRFIRARHRGYRISFLQPTYGTQVYSKYKFAEEWLDYNGKIYCAEVPNHTLYVRRSGKAVWCGNTGTVMVAALVGRRVVCMDIEDSYVKILEQGVQSLEAIAPGISDMITIIPGDCSKILPIYGIDHIVFSPPYTNILKKSTKMLDKLSRETLGDGLMKYSKHPNNIGNLNEFLYHQVMEKIYKRTLESLNPGGTLTIIIKDHIEAGKRVFLGNRAERDCVRAGYEAMGHYKWLPPGTVYTNIMRARGDLVVDDESVIILKKPGRIG